MDEENVLDFLTSLEAMDLPDRIEEVNARILSKIVQDTDYVAVLFCKCDDTSTRNLKGQIFNEMKCASVLICHICYIINYMFTWCKISLCEFSSTNVLLVMYNSFHLLTKLVLLC
jgi:hypothetical protein